jgi:hypothetical protein
MPFYRRMGMSPALATRGGYLLTVSSNRIESNQIRPGSVELRQGSAFASLVDTKTNGRGLSKGRCVLCIDRRKMTDSIPLCVKWGKETIKMDFIVDSGVKGLKTELQEKTGVPADRMKLMAKSKGTYRSAFMQGSILVSVSHTPLFDQASGRVC